MAPLVDVAVPADQAEGTEMVVGTWFKQVGEAVTENEPLLEINTDKVTVEVAAPATGVLREILKTPEQAVEPGEVLGRIEAGAAPAGTSPTTAKAAAAHAPPSPEAPAAAAELTPAVRRLLAEHGLEASSIHGSGKGGRITVQDVEAHTARCVGPSRSTWSRASRLLLMSRRCSRQICPRSLRTARQTVEHSRPREPTSPTPPTLFGPALPRCRQCRR